MHVLVFEPDHTGHHFAYLGFLLPALARLASAVSVVTAPKALDAPEYRSHLAPLPAGVSVYPIAETPKGAPLKAAARKLASLRRAMRQLAPDHVFVPYADGLTQVLSVASSIGIRVIPPRIESEALIMRGGYAYPAQGRVDRWKKTISLAALSHSPWTILHHLDPIPYEVIQRKGGRLAERSRLMPDPVERPAYITRTEARRQLSIPEDGRYVGCVGAMDERKGIDLLIRAFHDANLGATDRLLLMGRMSPGIRSELGDTILRLERSRRLIVFDEFINHEQLRIGIAAMDLVCTPYPRHIGSASVVLHAVAGKRPVLGSEFGWIGATVPRFGLGWTCDVLNHGDFTRSLAASMERCDTFEPSLASERLLEFHSPSNFAAAWTERLRVRMGLPQDVENRRQWDWVLQACDFRNAVAK